MTAPQATGAGLGGVLAGVLVNLLHKYAGYDVTLTDASAVTVAMLAFGGTFAHAVSSYGILGVFKVIWKGKQAG